MHTICILPITKGVVAVVLAVVTVVTSSQAFITRLLISTLDSLSNTTTTLATGLSSLTTYVVG